MHRILALWAHPRSLSTALERVFIERGDLAVMHEPFSAVYYVHERRAVAADADFDPNQETDYRAIRARIVEAARRSDVCFKDMCYHCHDHLMQDEAFLQRITSVFLIRDPRQAIASHYAKNPQVTSEEIGYEKQALVFRKVAALNGAPPVVIAAEDLQQDPAGVWSALCRRLRLEHRPQALQWETGLRDEWRTWARWHGETAQSTEIHSGQTPYTETVDSNPRLAAFHEFHRPFYDEMKRYRLVAEDAG